MVQINFTDANNLHQSNILYLHGKADESFKTDFLLFLMERSSPSAFCMALAILKKTAYRVTSCQYVPCKLFFLFPFSHLFPLPDALSGVSLTEARFSDRIRSKGGRLYPERLCRLTLQLSEETYLPLYLDNGNK